jgi:transposase
MSAAKAKTRTPPAAVPAGSPSSVGNAPTEPTPTAQKSRRLAKAAKKPRRADRQAEKSRQQAEACAKIQDLPVPHSHAAGIDVGDASHWVCVEATPDGSDTVREFPAHTPGLRQLVAWWRQCGVTTIALEATGVYGHVLYLTLLEAGFAVITAPPPFARQIQGRSKTDKRDCPWIQRLHKLGLLPSIVQPNEATHTLRDYVRQRANLVRLSGQHIQRMPKALELMNLKLTKVLGDVTGVTSLKMIRALVAGQRDPECLAQLRDRRCRHTTAEMALALDGRYRPEHVTERRLSLSLWEKYQEAIQDLDTVIALQLKSLRQQTSLPPRPPRTWKRGRKPHDPHFHVRAALYDATGLDRTAIEGIDEMHALTLVSELGMDLSKWPTRNQFTSWLGLCPNGKKTGGKVKSSHTRRGKNRAAGALRLAAWSLMRSQSYLGAYLRRQRSRLGAPKAITATAHKLARIVYHLVRFGEAYIKQTEEAYAAQVRERLEKQWHRRARDLGYTLTKVESAAPTAPATDETARGRPIGKPTGTDRDGRRPREGMSNTVRVNRQPARRTLCRTISSRHGRKGSSWGGMLEHPVSLKHRSQLLNVERLARVEMQ